MYGVLLAFSVVYTLFFAVCIVCLARGGMWWVKELRERGRRRAEAFVPATA